MRRHPFDPVSLMAGLLFLVVALAFLGGDRSVADLAPTWLWGLPTLALGIMAILVGATRLRSREADAEDAEAAQGDEAPSEGTDALSS